MTEVIAYVILIGGLLFMVGGLLYGVLKGNTDEEDKT